MARGKEKPLLKAKLPRAKAKGKAKARPSVADSESYVHFRTADWSSLDTEVKVEKITGHCLVASGHRIWCIGGDREVEGKSPAKISLLMMDLRYRRWEDHTPPAASYAPSWRWGHSSCMLPTKFPVRPQHKQRKVMLMCGGFDREMNHLDSWHFCPLKGRFFPPASGLKHVPLPGAYHSLAYCDVTDHVYLFGGQCCVGGPYHYFDAVFEHDLMDPHWALLPRRGPTPEARAQHAAVISNRVMIIHGGTNGIRSFRDLWTLDLDADPPRWSEVKIEGPPLWVGVRPRARFWEVVPHRPFMAVSSCGGIMVAQRQKPEESQPGKLGLFALNLQKPRWRRVRSNLAPAWAGNFGAVLGGEGDHTLFVFGGSHCNKAGDLPPPSGAAQLHAGSMWKINISAQPCEVLLQTLLRVFRARSGSFPEEVMQNIFTFAMGSLIDMVCRM